MEAIDRLKLAGWLVRRGRFAVLSHELARRLGSQELAFGFKKDLAVPREVTAEGAYSVRLGRPGDVDRTLSLDEPDLTAAEIKERMRRRLLILHDVPTCYVVVDEDDEPVYLQWVIRPSDNDRVEQYFGGGFPRLEHDEIMIENAFMRRSHRGRGLMKTCLSLFSRMAFELGARHLITFVQCSNGRALRAVERAGFVRYVLREDRWFLFRRTVTFRALPDLEPR